MRTLWRTLRDGSIVIFSTLVFATGLKSCIIDAYKIPSASMEPALQIGDYLLVNKFIYGARTPQKFLYIPLPQIEFPAVRSVRRGDVIVFEFPGEPNEVLPVRNLFLIKRCIALPGDTVEISEGNVRVNGLRTDFFGRAAADLPVTIVPQQGMRIAMDNTSIMKWKVFIQREGSSVDVRGGIVQIDGAETSSYTVKRNYYFALGDNLNNSSDSRMWGFIPEENIVGRAMLVYFARNDSGVQWNRIGTFVR